MPASGGGPLNDEYSRRKFLRAAVVGTAGVAGAAGVAGVVLTQHGSGPGLLSTHAFPLTSVHPTYTPCLENTFCGTAGDSGCASVGTLCSTDDYAQSYFAVLAITNLALNTTYTFDLEQQVNSTSSAGWQPIHAKVTGQNHSPDTQPWCYQAGSNGGNVIFYYVDPTKGTNPIQSSDCPYQQPANASQVTGGTTGSDSVPATFTTPSSVPSGAGTVDVLIFVHLSWGATTPSSTEHVYLRYELFAGSTESGTALYDNSSSPVDITAKHSCS